MEHITMSLKYGTVSSQFNKEQRIACLKMLWYLPGNARLFIKVISK